MRKRIVFSVAALIAVLATPSTTTPPEFKDDADEAVRWYRMAAEQGHGQPPSSASGTLYDLEQGVLEDSVLAHMWFNIAGVKRGRRCQEASGTGLNVT